MLNKLFFTFSATFFHYRMYICWYELIKWFRITNSHICRKKSYNSKFQDIVDFLDRAISKCLAFWIWIDANISKNLEQQKNSIFVGDLTSPWSLIFKVSTHMILQNTCIKRFWQELIFKFICDFASWAKLLPSFK